MVMRMPMGTINNQRVVELKPQRMVAIKHPDLHKIKLPRHLQETMDLARRLP